MAGLDDDASQASKISTTPSDLRTPTLPFSTLPPGTLCPPDRFTWLPRMPPALKPVLAALWMVPVVEAVSVPFFTKFLAAHLRAGRRVGLRPEPPGPDR